MDPLWTWQPGDGATGPGLRGPYLKILSMYAADAPPEWQHVIEDYENQVRELSLKVESLEKDAALREMITQLEELGYRVNKEEDCDE